MLSVTARLLLRIVSMTILLAAAAAYQLQSSCYRECSQNAYPICASDGVTYLNACHFDAAYCANRELVPVYYGSCNR